MAHSSYAFCFMRKKAKIFPGPLRNFCPFFFIILSSVSPMEVSATSYDSSVVRSCDTQSHQPIRSEESDSQLIARQSAIGIEREGEGQGEEPVVNEEAIHQTMEMSQRLNIDTLSRSHFQFWPPLVVFQLVHMECLHMLTFTFNSGLHLSSDGNYM